MVSLYQYPRRLVVFSGNLMCWGVEVVMNLDGVAQILASSGMSLERMNLMENMRLLRPFFHLCIGRTLLSFEHELQCL